MGFRTNLCRFAEFRERRTAPAARAAVIGLMVVACFAPAAAAQKAPRFTLPSDLSVPVLVMRQRPTELSEDATQEVRIFGDGRCSLHRPAVMRGAGNHVWTISPTEVNELLRRAVDAGLADLDAHAHRARLRSQADAAANSGTQYFRFDDDTIEFDIRIDAYASPGESVRRDVRRSIEWRGLRTDRVRHPGDEPVRLLLELRDELDRMTRTRAPVDAQP